jgi:hypothetical protein
MTNIDRDKIRAGILASQFWGQAVLRHLVSEINQGLQNRATTSH